MIEFLKVDYPISKADLCIDSSFNMELDFHVSIGQTVFVYADKLKFFFDNIVPKMKTPFRLVTGMGSILETIDECIKYADNELVMSWTGTNIMVKNHPKIVKIPTGFQVSEDQNLLNNLHENRIDFINKECKVMISHIGGEHQYVESLKKLAKDDKLFYFAESPQFEKYITVIDRYKFVICPVGKAVDASRFWETLLVGSVPIVETSNLDDFYSKFPCIVVNSFEDVTNDILRGYEFDDEKYAEYIRYIDSSRTPLKQIEFLTYNYIPVRANYCVDFEARHYEAVGVRPQHNYPILDISIMKHGQTVFVKVDMMQYFMTNIMPHIRVKFHLITGVGGHLFSVNLSNSIVNHSNVISWTGTNIVISGNSKLFTVPIGFRLHGSVSQNILNRLHREKPNFEDKICNIMVSYLSPTHSSRNTLQERMKLLSFAQIYGKMQFEPYIKCVSRYKFLLCPKGHAADTFRFWESLLVGSVPIVETSYLDCFYKKFPCIIVKSFDDLTEEMLTNYKFDEIKYAECIRYLDVSTIPLPGVGYSTKRFV
jgi:hypothetical protein